MVAKCMWVICVYFAVISVCRAFNVYQWVENKENKGYDKMTAPGQYSKRTTPVSIQLYVESIGNFRASTMDYDLDVYFVEVWTDARLKHNYTLVTVNDRLLIQRIWLPDIYFANSKQAHVNDVTVPNCVLKIWPNGTIRYSIRISLKLSCPMDLKAYPMDKQNCVAKIVTYGNTIDRVNVTWTKIDPILLDPGILEADLHIDRGNVHPSYCNGTYFGMVFSCLSATFHLRRYIEYSLLRTYIPTFVIVAISWLSFWIDPSSVPGRVGLSITTLLTMFTQAIAMHFSLPPVSYATAQDVWFGMCICFQFFGLIEFAIVNQYTRRADNALKGDTLSDAKILTMLRAKKSQVQISGKGVAAIPLVESLAQGDDRRKEKSATLNLQIFGKENNEIDEEALRIKRQQMADKNRRVAIALDRISRFAFPAAFAMFSVFYWSYYFFL